MARTDELKRRVERLLAGDFNTRDLDTLFLWLRARSFGNTAVADLGDFIAHSDERERGIAWRGVQGFFNVARFMLPRIRHPDNPPPSTLDEVRHAAWSTFEALPPAGIRARTGLGKTKAKRVLQSALDAIVSLEGPRLTVRRPLTPKEEEVLKLFTSVLNAKPAFTDDILFSQLFKCLVKNGLISSTTSEPPRAFHNFVALYAIEKMHLSKIILRDGLNAELKAGISSEDGKEVLIVNAAAMVPMPDFELAVSFTIYMTELDPWEWCAPELLPERRSGKSWDCPLEIGPSGKLQML